MKKTLLFRLIGLATVLGACSSGTNQEQNNPGIPVQICSVELKQQAMDSEYIGIVEEELSASVSFPVNGTINKMHATEGQQVHKGDLLAGLNSYSLDNAHKATLATLKQAEDAMKRLQSLYKNKSLPEIKYIEMQTNLEKARSAEAIAKKNLADSRLTAPFDGIIGHKVAEAGENVLPNQSVLTLLKIDKIKIKISVPEKEINTIQVNQPALIKVTAANRQQVTGTVSEKGIVADPVSHTYTVRILTGNPDKVLLPGMIANVNIMTGSQKMEIAIPYRCIQKSGDGKTFVWKVISDHARKQTITTGKQSVSGVEVLNGLSVGDKIVIDGYQKLSEGLKVREL